MSEQQIKVPDIGDFDEVAVIEVLVKVGDTVKAEQSLITVESDKASMEIPSSAAGVVKSLAVKVGDSAAVHARLLAAGIEVSLLGNYGLGEWLRVSVGLPEQNRALLAALR